ncbi:MAG TPA: 3-deoxy-D-manno-octulosonic acid transferase [Xanthobacteraceae bacterium]|nr:3-deoxy-D-manno-octulosonic acid transferase [Xanthobacteraceae bacterium]
MDERLPFTLRAYRRLAATATPLLPLLASYRLRRGKEQGTRVRERRGESEAPRPDAPLVWIHAASVGEMLAVAPIVEHIGSSGFAVLVTSGTVTSARMAERRLPIEAIHQFAPFDAPRYVARFLDHWRPDLALFAESDLWPNLITAAAERKIPLILVNGRLSERSFARWRRMPRTIAALLRRFDLCLAQSVSDAERYGALGAPRITTTGNLKLDVPAPPARDDALAAIRAAVRDRPVIAAASTHPGEETIIVEVHRALRSKFPSLLTMVAPRHPERGPGVLQIANVAGLKAVARSRGHLPDGSTDIYVSDTMGELGLIYRIAPIVFMGGSLVRHGGQNPIEPAKLGAAILHGPHVWNFAEIYAALDKAEGAAEVADGAKLSDRIAGWLTDAPARRAAADAALSTVEKLAGARSRTLAALEPYLLALRLQYR